MLAYEFHLLRRDSFPDNKLYEQTFADFEQIFRQQVTLREARLQQIVRSVFDAVKSRSGEEGNDEFELVLSGGDGVVPGGHLVRLTGTVQQIFEVPLFEVDYAFTRWDLENRIMNHYTYKATAPFTADDVFQANSVRVKVFSKGAVRPIIEEEFRKREKEFEKLSKGFALQVVEN